MINSAAAGINGRTPSPNMHYPGFGFATSPLTSTPIPRLSSAYDLASEFGQMQMSMPRTISGGAYHMSLGHSRPNDKISKRSNDINFLGEKGLK